MKDEPHIEAAKYLCKIRLSHLAALVESRTLNETISQLLRLVLELQEATGQKFLNAE